MHKTAIALSTLLLLGAVARPVASEEARTPQAGTQREAAQAEQICDYSVGLDGMCQVYTHVPLAADQIRPAYQVGLGHPQVARPQSPQPQEPVKVAVTQPTTTK